MVVAYHIGTLSEHKEELEKELSIALSFMAPDMHDAYQESKATRKLEKKRRKRKREK